LEDDETVETIRKALMARAVKLRPGGDLDVARITMNDPLKKVLRTAMLMGRIWGGRLLFDGLLAQGERKIRVLPGSRLSENTTF